MNIFLLLFTILGKLGTISSVEIFSMRFPEASELGSDLVLDCNYRYRKEEEEQLDIKWYFDGSPEPFYQWVPSINTGPQIIDRRFQHHLDLGFTVNSNKYQKHRALHLVNVTRDLSGPYMCKVSSFLDEDFNQRSIFIYVPPSVIEFSQDRSEETNLTTVTCSVSGVSPRPTATLSWNVGEYPHAVTETMVEREDDLHDVIVTSSIHSDKLSPEVTLACEISIPGTPFYVREEIPMNPFAGGQCVGSCRDGSVTLLSSSSSSLISLALLFLVECVSRSN